MASECPRKFLCSWTHILRKLNLGYARSYVNSCKCAVPKILGIENSFELIFHPGFIRILALRTGKYWSDSNKYTSCASDVEKWKLS